MWCKLQSLFFVLCSLISLESRCSITGHQSADGREHARLRAGFGEQSLSVTGSCIVSSSIQFQMDSPTGLSAVVGRLVACRMFVRVCCPSMIWTDSGVWYQFVKSHGSTMESCCAWQAAVHKFQQTPTVIAWRVMIGSTSSCTIYTLNITPFVSKKVFSTLLLPSLGKCNFSIALSETIFWSNLYKKYINLCDTK